MYTESLKGRSVIRVIASSGAGLPTRVPKGRPPLTVDQITREGVVYPQLPSVANTDQSLGARVLRELAAAKVMVVVTQDAVRLFDPRMVSAHLLGLFNRHYNEIFQILRPMPPPQEVQACVEWLREFGEPTKTLRELENSYDLKHLVEKWYGHYIWNGAFTVAAIQEGYAAFQDCGAPPDAVFNLSVARWRSAVRRCENEGLRKGQACYLHPMHRAHRDYREFKSYKPREQSPRPANAAPSV